MKNKSANYHLAKHLLNGKSVSIKTGLMLFGMSCIPREIGRGIEKKFGVTCDRKRIDFTSRYKHTGFYFEYTLKETKANKEGIKLMRKYIASYESK